MNAIVGRFLNCHGTALPGSIKDFKLGTSSQINVSPPCPSSFKLVDQTKAQLIYIELHDGFEPVSGQSDVTHGFPSPFRS
jgi:hypothetical protein